MANEQPMTMALHPELREAIALLTGNMQRDVALRERERAEYEERIEQQRIDDEAARATQEAQRERHIAQEEKLDAARAQSLAQNEHELVLLERQVVALESIAASLRKPRQ